MHRLQLLSLSLLLLGGSAPLTHAAPPADKKTAPAVVKKTVPGKGAVTPPGAPSVRTGPPTISLIAIGDASPGGSPIEDEKNGLQLPTQDEIEASFPPTSLYTPGPRGAEHLMLNLNAASSGIRIPAQPELLLYQDADPDHPFAKAPLPVATPATAAEDLLVILLRNPETKSWRKSPLAHVFKNGLQTFPLNSVRVINFSSHSVMLNIQATEPLGLGAGSATVLPVTRNEDGTLPFRITTSGAAGSEPIVIAQSTTRYPADARLNLVIYNTDGPDKTRPAGVSAYFELPEKTAPKAVPVVNKTKAGKKKR